MSSEAKIGRILILVSVVIGILAIILLSALAALIHPRGQLDGFGIELVIPFWILVSLIGLKTIGVILGIVALYYARKEEFSLAGVLAAISSVLPPIDLLMLIGGIFCLISREAEEGQIPSPPPP